MRNKRKNGEDRNKTPFLIIIAKNFKIVKGIFKKNRKKYPENTEK